MEFLLKHTIDLLKSIHRVDLGRYDADFATKAVVKRVSITQSISDEAYLDMLRQDERELKALMDSLQNNYSEFFRNPLTFTILESFIFPGLCAKGQARSKPGIRVWSAACAEGQEAYSLAMLLEEMKSSSPENFRFLLLATDQNETWIENAQKGIYTPDVVNNTSLKRAWRWFDFDNSYYSVKQELKKHISFSVHDLLDERWSSPPAGIFGSFNLIFCANMLFYYKEPYRKIILDKLANCLVGDGYLVTGEAERDIILKGPFKEVFPQSAIFQKKTTL